MAKKPTLSDVTNIYTSAPTINANNDRIEEAFENTLSRDGSTPNQMEADLDMNGNDILNVDNIQVNGSFQYNGVVVGPSEFFSDEVGGYLDQAEGFAQDAEDSATAAASSAATAAAAVGSILSFSTISEILANTDSFDTGSILFIRDGAYTFEVVSSDPDLTTAGGEFLRALPDSHGFVHVEQFGAVGDGNRYTGAGTDNTDAFRAAFATPHNIKIGLGVFVVTDTIQNLVENRVVEGCGMGTVNSSPIGDWLYFNAPTHILAVGDAAVRRVITRRNYRASASDPNDPAMSAVIENWGMGTTYKNFSIELFCDYIDDAQSNLGADWDIGFFNGCRGTVGLDHVSIMGYFRKASCYWDVTDAYGIPNLLDIYGNPVPFPTAGDDDGPEYGRGSGADGCWMNRCEIRGRLARVILGPRAGSTGADYYDWVTDATYSDFRGGSGASDFRSTDCSLRVGHHSNYRMADPIGYGGTLTYANMMLEDDFTPGVQHIDSGITNGPDSAGPSAAARGIVLDDLRYVTREPFSTRLGQVKEIHFGFRTWAESNGTPPTLLDTSGADIYSNRVNETTHFYGHLCTNEYTGLVTWNYGVTSLFTRWVYDWRYVKMTDRQGRERGLTSGWFDIGADSSYTLDIGHLRPGGFINIMAGGIGNNTPLVGASAHLWYDVLATSPNIQTAGYLGSNLTVLAPSTTPNSGNTPSGNLSVSAFGDGTLRFYNRLNVGAATIAWSVA